MIRYHCPHCAALIVAHERRAGQSSVCKACLKPHPIPADKSSWLDESGELLHPPVAPVAPAAPARAEEPETVVSHGSAADHEGLAPTRPDFQLLPEPAAPEPVPSDPPTRPSPRLPRAPVAESAPVAAGPVATATPPPAAPSPPERGRRQPAPVPAPRRSRRSAPVPAPVPVPVPTIPEPVGYGEPVQLQTQADIAVALTAALTSRMKPPAAPRRDLRPSTAGWMLLTGIGVMLVALAAFSDPAYRWPAYLVGAVQIVCGYVWIVRLTHLRDPRRGAVCAVPPLTAYYLAQYKYAKFRPLRFVLTGLVLVGLAGAAPALHGHARALVGRASDPPPPAPPDPATQSKRVQLRHYRERQAYDPLMNLLDVLAKTDPLLSEDAKDRAELAAELKALCGHPDMGVKVKAMSAYARWDPDGARAVCLAAVRSQAPEEREEALKLLPQWRDAEAARAVQSLIGRPGTVETNRAKAALEEIGGPPAEQAAIALLNRSDDQATRLTALSILEKVGGAEGLAYVRNYALATDDPAVRTRALSAAEVMEARLRPAGP
jgi:hypothetical protein